jgi:hypothetical protein
MKTQLNNHGSTGQFVPIPANQLSFSICGITLKTGAPVHASSAACSKNSVPAIGDKVSPFQTHAESDRAPQLNQTSYGIEQFMERVPGTRSGYHVKCDIRKLPVSRRNILRAAATSTDAAVEPYMEQGQTGWHHKFVKVN